MMESITITYELSVKDFMNAWSAHWSCNRQGSAGHIGTAIGFILVACIGWVLHGPLWLTAAAAIFAILWILLLVMRWHLHRRAYFDMKKFTSNITVSFRPDTIHVETVDGKSDLNWTTYSHYLETKDYFLMYMAKRHFSIIPKRPFVEQGSLEDFKGLLRQKITGNQTTR